MAGISGRRAALRPQTSSLATTIPGGKLPITVPRSVGQLPDYYYQKPTAKREYLGSTTEPLFPFGWGLSYSTFSYRNVQSLARLNRT